jgi:hypothetical protein
MEAHMKKQNAFLLFSTSLVLLLVSACGATNAVVSSTPTQDMLIITSMAETAQANVIATMTQVANLIPSNTSIVLQPNTATLSPSPFVIDTPLPLKPMISVSAPTLCRAGPDKVFDRVGELVAGKLVQVFGLDPSHEYYYIENPNQSGTFCWVWGFYATAINNFSGVPVYTPAYTPTSRYTPTQTATPKGGPCTITAQVPANNSKIAPGIDFDASWTIKNTTDIDWIKTQVDWVFASGTELHKPAFGKIMDLPTDVLRNASIKLTMDMVAPASIGTYTETWQLKMASTLLCKTSITIIVGP